MNEYNYLKKHEGRNTIGKSFVYINDDEVNCKHILIRIVNSKNCKKTYTLSGAEKRGLVKIETGFYKFGGRTYSKSIALLDSCVSIFLTTKIFG